MLRLVNGTTGNDTLNGSWANDVLDGGAGADLMTGGGGDDTYYVDNVNDVVREIPDYPVNTDTAIQIASTSVGGVLGNSQSGGNMLAVSGDGNLVAFYSRASNLLVNDTNGGSADIDVKNMDTGAVASAHTTSNNTQPTSGQGGGPDAGYQQLQMTPDGRYLVFTSTSVGLIPSQDSSTDADIFVKDMQTGTITIESQPSGGVSSYHSSSPDISSDGRYVVFTSMDNLVGKTDANGAGDTDVFWRDRQTGELRLVSGLADGTQGSGGGSDSYGATVTDDGQWVLFQSSATNLDLTVVDTNGSMDLFLRNMSTGVITNLTLVGVDGKITNGSSYDASITPDAHYAVFYSGSGNLVPGNYYQDVDILRADLTTGEVLRVNTNSAGVAGTSGQHAQITPDGRYVVFESTDKSLVTVAGDSSLYNKIFVKDMVTGGIEMVSRTETGGTLTGYAYAPQISDDGRFIVFNTQAVLATGDSGTNEDVYRVPNPLYSPTDEIVTSVDYTLPANVEVLTMASAASNLSGTGNELDNAITGNDWNNSLNGAAGNDRLIGGAGNDSIDGGAGIDTAVYTGSRSNFVVQKTSNGFTLTDKTGALGSDSLQNIEHVWFPDGGVSLAVGATQSGGATVLLLGAVLPGRLVFDSSKQSMLGAVIDLFDQGYTMQQLSGAVMRLPIWDILTGKALPGSSDIASYLLTNVNGMTPDAATLAGAVAALDAQPDIGHGQGDFLWQLAASAANQQRVDLVGLANTGLAYEG